MRVIGPIQSTHEADGTSATASHLSPQEEDMIQRLIHAGYSDIAAKQCVANMGGVVPTQLDDEQEAGMAQFAKPLSASEKLAKAK